MKFTLIRIMTLGNNRHKALGIMSGTSLDGVDLCACEFWIDKNNWQFNIVAAQTYPYKPEMYRQLKNAHRLSGYDLARLNVRYGKYLGDFAQHFFDNHKFAPDFIASHGYTVFHEPGRGITLQIGSGAEIAALTGIQTVCDFRTGDMARGGQGAPLVPIGDDLLFGGYTACLNLGGFANISYAERGSRLAFDICPVNYILNYFALKLGAEFDKDGKIGRCGLVNNELLSRLNQVNFYKKAGPKSLGREFVENEILPLISNNIKTEDVLTTLYHHIACKLAGIINALPSGKILITGGGALNKFLIELLENQIVSKVAVPDATLINFKEALVFAFLGLLRLTEQVNCLSSATGASYDSIGGAVYQ